VRGPGPHSPMAPIANSGWLGVPSLETTEHGDHEDIQRRMQNPSDLAGNRRAAPGQTEDRLSFIAR